MQNTHKPFHQKYRPKTLDELVGQQFISTTLKQALLTKKIAPAYLFNGPRGTGKTSSARIFAKSLNCLSCDQPTANPCNQCELCSQINNGNALDIIEIDAASNTGVENIREIIERARFAPSQARWKVYVIDECHMLSAAASNALLKTIEEPPSRVVFILATTNPERVLTTIQSRCQKFDFKRISSKDIFQNLSEIANRESIKFQNQALQLIAKRSNGGMRDAQSTLDQLSLLPNGITLNHVQNLLGEVSEIDLISLINSLIDNNPESLLINCNKLFDAGNEPNQIIVGLLNITRDLLLNSMNSEYSEIYYTSFEFQSELNKLGKSLDKLRIIGWHNKLKNVEHQIKTSDNPRLWLEIHLTSLLTTHEMKNGLNNNIQEISQTQSTKESLDRLEEVHKENVSKISKNDNKIDNLKDKWELILSKVELPSTRMLLSQQAELESINSSEIVIALSPNWENMIKSRKIIIENALKKLFGEQIKLNFSRKDVNSIQLSKRPENINDNSNNPQPIKKIEPKKSNIPESNSLEETYGNGSKNLANFFNGEIIEIEE